MRVELSVLLLMLTWPCILGSPPSREHGDGALAQSEGNSYTLGSDHAVRAVCKSLKFGSSAATSAASDITPADVPVASRGMRDTSASDEALLSLYIMASLMGVRLTHGVLRAVPP